MTIMAPRRTLAAVMVVLCAVCLVVGCFCLRGSDAVLAEIPTELRMGAKENEIAECDVREGSVPVRAVADLGVHDGSSYSITVEYKNGSRLPVSGDEKNVASVLAELGSRPPSSFPDNKAWTYLTRLDGNFRALQEWQMMRLADHIGQIQGALRDSASYEEMSPSADPQVIADAKRPRAPGEYVWWAYEVLPTGVMTLRIYRRAPGGDAGLDAIKDRKSVV